MPHNAKKGRYVFQAQGNTGGALGGTSFWEEREVIFKPQFLTILIQTSQLVYNLEQKSQYEYKWHTVLIDTTFVAY